MDQATQDKLVGAAKEAFQSTEVVLAYAYGSRVSGNPRPDSDLDVGYYLRGLPQHAVLSIREEMTLAGKLSDQVGLEVDLRNLGEAPLELRGRALEEGVRVFCCDEVFRVNLERDLLGMYHDYKETFQRMHEERLRKIAAGGF
jgi:predicted nucleotidyltransferase